MSGIVGKNAGRASGIVGAGDVGADAVDSANIADDAIDSEHYADGSIDNAHIADDAIDSEHYADGSIDNAHIADDAIDSEHYADGSIDNAHIADDAIDSEHYADGSIDTAHIATNQIDETLIKDAFVGDFTDATVTASDYFLHGDATDSGNTKKDTVQGILDLTSGGFTTAAHTRQGSDTAVAHATWVKILFSDDSTVSGEHKSYDEDGDYDAGNSKFVAPADGKYLVHASLNYYSSNVDTKVYRAAIYVNGTNVHWSEVDCTANGNYQFPQVTAISKLDASDYVEIYGWQSSGASSNVEADNHNSHFKVHRLS